MKNAVTNSSRSSVTLRVLFLPRLTVHWGLRSGGIGEVQAETQTPSAEWLHHLWGPLSPHGMSCTRLTHKESSWRFWQVVFWARYARGMCHFQSTFSSQFQLAGATGDSWPSHKPRRKMKWEFVHTLSSSATTFLFFFFA